MANTPPSSSLPTITVPVSPASSEAAAHLQYRLTARQDDLLNALSSGNFYIELALIVVALGLAWLTANYLVQKIKARVTASPPKRIDPEFILKPLCLLPATMTLPFLWFTQGILTQFGISDDLTRGVLQICYAWLMVKCVAMVIKQRTVAFFISAAIIINAVLSALRVERSVAAWLDSLAVDIGRFHITALHLVHGFIIFIVVFWGAGVLSSTLESYLRRSTRMSATSRHLTTKFFRVFIYVLALIITLSAVGIDLTAFAIFGGALGVGIGLGLQKMVSNFFSGVTMLMERSIKIGDLIEVGGYSGWVRELNIRYALIETSDGRDIIIPNEELMSTRVVNWTLSSTMASIEVKAIITFDSDAVKARELMLQAALEHPVCLKNPQPSCWIREFANTGISLALTFWIQDVAQGRNGPQSDVMFATLKKFRENGIVFAKA
jgi:small-conductance mechanosensitive channel